MDRKYWRGRALDLGPDADDGDPLGPDERDADLLDDTWENEYLRRPYHRRDSWRVLTMVLSLLALAGILVPMALVLTQ